MLCLCWSRINPSSRYFLFVCSIDHLFAEPLEEKYDINQPLQQQIHMTQDPLLPPAQMPTNEEFGGKYDFRVLPDQQDDTKSWVVSFMWK